MTVERARQFLAQCRDVDEVKELRDKAETIARYQRSRSAAEDSGVSAAVIARRAERRLGELVAELPKAPAGRPKEKNRSHAATNCKIPTLADHGITKSESSRWQAIASVPEKKFEATIAEAIEAKKPPTSAALVRLVRPKKTAAPVAPIPATKATAFDPDEALEAPGVAFDEMMIRWPRTESLAPVVDWLKTKLGMTEQEAKQWPTK